MNWRWEYKPTSTHGRARAKGIEAWWFLEGYEDKPHPCVEIRRDGIFVAPVHWGVAGEYGPYETVADAKQVCETAIALNQLLFK